MSLIKTIRQQLGLSVTPANNFTLDASADNGTMKLARGNAGATTQDILTVDAAGKVSFPQQGQSLAASGYVKLPGGLIIQWGSTSGLTGGSGSITFPTPFPTACFAFNATLVPSAGYGFVSADTPTTTSVQVVTRNSSATPTLFAFSWIAVGY